MTHDPLCPRATYDMPCCCNLIERVRLSEQHRAIERSLEDIYADLDGLPALRIIWSICPDMNKLDWQDLEEKYPSLFLGK